MNDEITIESSRKLTSSIIERNKEKMLAAKDSAEREYLQTVIELLEDALNCIEYLE